MKSVLKAFGIIALVAVIGFSFSACGGDDDGGGGSSLENKPVAERWGKWIAPTATATLDYSVAEDGVCTITVGGTAQPNNQTDDFGRWKANAQYEYTAKAGKSFIYTFEAWTQSGDRVVNFQYCNVDANNIYLEEEISLTTTRKTHTVYGKPIAKGSLNHVEFQCADQLGTFYVKILEIKEVSSSGKGKLTVTGIPSEYNDMFAFAKGDVVDVSVENGYVYGAAKLEWKEMPGWGGLRNIYYTPVKISGGKVEIPMYIDGPKNTFKAYNGNGVLSSYDGLKVNIVNYNTPVLEGGNYIRKIFKQGTFVNGGMTVQWDQGE